MCITIKHSSCSFCLYLIALNSHNWISSNLKLILLFWRLIKKALANSIYHLIVGIIFIFLIIIVIWLSLLVKTLENWIKIIYLFLLFSNGDFLLPKLYFLISDLLFLLILLNAHFLYFGFPFILVFCFLLLK